MLSVKSWTS